MKDGGYESTRAKKRLASTSVWLILSILFSLTRMVMCSTTANAGECHQRDVTPYALNCRLPALTGKIP
jgi:hypothetical protein